MKVNKLALIGSEYHSKKISEVINSSGIDADVIKLGSTLKSIFKVLRNYDAFYVTYTSTTFRFICAFLIPAFIMRKRVYFQWIGSDVLDLESSKYRTIRAFLSDNLAINLCECDWIKDELEELGVNAKVGPYITFSSIFESLNVKSSTVSSNNKKLVLTTYAPEGREDLYSLNDIISLAKIRKDIILNVVAHTGKGFPKLSNVNYHGWLQKDELDKLYLESDVFIRMTKHDGLSYSVLESMAIGMQVVFSYDYPFTFTAKNTSDLESIVSEFQTRKENEEDIVNHQGIEYIKQEFIDSRVSESNLLALLRYEF
ncbi:hypothetical protein JCM19235_2789 [Vibrio maritimus]|uniref:Glycosyltransferase n=1 Tax=Vibrio maritimus TaxID=990268 RepID=A0A090S302_9VIBR|nr:hypothetical protein JCM19235_2789 [Vibrio maritimus]